MRQLEQTHMLELKANSDSNTATLVQQLTKTSEAVLAQTLQISKQAELVHSVMDKAQLMQVNKRFMLYVVL